MSSEILDVSGVASVGSSSFNTGIQGQTGTFTSPAVTPAAAGDLILGVYGAYSQSSDVYTPPAGWNAGSPFWTATSNCAGAAMDWSQSASTSPVAATITDSNGEYHYSGAIDLHP
jgi:hypothetical protein